MSQAVLATSYAITGGIGSGKSYVCRLLEARSDPVFYCDDEAKRILRTDQAVRGELQTLIGQSVYAEDGTLQKSVLAAYLCRGTECAERVNAIVHPRVAAAFRAWASQQVARHRRIFMECALLFESGFDQLVDKSVLVYAPEDVRLRRVMERDHITAETARRWMALQMPEEEKRRRADLEIRNDGISPLESQIDTLLP